ncbi:MAG: hypothetical protein M1327_04605 [Candidatus Thermoplasmatota archaeon]|nr:hypothetical protein [Candidatus Thermoplasmatota archaeon]
MTRMNLSLRTELAKKLQEEAEREGKMISSITGEALQMYFDARKSGVDSNVVSKISSILNLMDSLRAVPVPSMLLDQILQIAIKNDTKASLEKWEEAGYAFAEVCQIYAPDLESLWNFAQLFKEFIPADRFETSFNEGETTILLVGAGFSLEASRCSLAGLSGLLRGYKYQIDDKHIEKGLVKVTCHQGKSRDN